MRKLSVVMITYNAERLLDRVLEKASQVADELIVVDSGSDDQTHAILKKWSAKVFEEPWSGFGLQKKKAMAYASNEWIFFLDADEVMDDRLVEFLKRWKASELDGSISAYRIKRPLVMGKSVLRRSISLWSLRLFRRSQCVMSEHPVHERIEAKGVIQNLKEGELLHYSYENFSDWLIRSNRYMDLSLEHFPKNSPKASVGFAIFSGLWTFFRTYFIKGGILEGKMGLVMSINFAFSNYLKYIKLAYRSTFEDQ